MSSEASAELLELAAELLCLVQDSLYANTNALMTAEVNDAPNGLAVTFNLSEYK